MKPSDIVPSFGGDGAASPTAHSGGWEVVCQPGPLLHLPRSVVPLQEEVN